MQSAFNPPGVRAPFGKYSHGVVTAQDGRMLFTSGQLGVRADDSVPESVEEQAVVCFENIGAILSQANMSFADVVRLNAYVTDREDMQPYMRVRDRYVSAPLPASTLMIVAGFTRPEFLVEVEATAVGA